MKKFLINGEFEDYFDSKILYRAKRYYVENRIWDVWCQDNLVTAYIDGSEIYKVELMIDEGRISHSYCSCPYSEDGEFMCKHMATLLYYLEENEVPELEKSKKKIENNKKDESELSKIYNGMQFELRKISDRYGFVNYYNGSYFVHLISEVSDYINGFIHDENYKDAFELIKYTYNFIKNTAMDGSNGEYQESFYIIDEVASKLLYDKEYYEKFLDYTYDVASSSALNDFSDAPLHAFILFVHDEESAKKVIEILGEIELRNGIFVNEVVEKITLTYDYIDEQEAIKMCYKNINYYGVKDLLISYLKKENKTDEIIRILKEDVKNYVRKDMAYDRLLEVYDENNMYEEKKKILPEVIIETYSFERFKELKSMCSDAEWDELKEKIISNIKEDNRGLLENIYMEENEADKLFELLKKDSSLSRLYKYQDVVKSKYSKELLSFYKPQIIEEAKRVSDRRWYHELCSYIEKMGELENSDDIIYEMLTQMYPNYKNKPAFKQEIMMVLNGKNKERFLNLI